MRLKLTLTTGGQADDVVLATDPTATVGEVAERLRAGHPRARPAVEPGSNLSLRVGVDGNARVLSPGTTMGVAGVRSGDTVQLTNAASAREVAGPDVATVTVVGGPDAGRQFGISGGTSLIGRERDCEVRLSDPLVSRRHAKLVITDRVEIVNDRSSNGVEVGGALVERATLPAGVVATIGDTALTVTLHTVAAATDARWALYFNRSPRLDPTYTGVEIAAPEPPQRPRPQRFPWISIVAPLLMGAVLYAVTKSLLSILFVGLSPIMLVGAYFEGRRSSKAELAQQTEEFREALTAMSVELQKAADSERTARRDEHPAVEQVAGAISEMSSLLWTRRPEHGRFGEIRLGLGRQSSRNSVKMPESNRTTPQLWQELRDVVGQFSTVDRVPVVGSLRAGGNIGVAGPATSAAPVAAGLVIQLVGLHSPAELVVAAVVSPTSLERWDWLKWLPHSGSEHSPIDVEHLAAQAHDQNALVAALEGLVRSRQVDDDNTPVVPTVIVVVEDDAPADRARLVQVAERGPAAGVHVLWVAPTIERIPAACRSFVEVETGTEVARGGLVHTSQGVDPIEVEPLSREQALRLARALSPVVDSGALLDDQSDLPRSVSLVDLSGPELMREPEEIIATWRAVNSLPEAEPQRLRRDNHLRALIGSAATGAFHVDLRADGPHALVGGTTGAGKSEFLQSWILSLAASHSPARVNFLFVDYKGGSAFADCVNLPHSVGLVTDLSPHLVRRALRSLRAELRRREHVLNAKKAKDLAELERRRDPEAPASLVIVVDEFAALVTDVPEFVDGVVDVAQRGRSLGLHLILATQRPAGVIKDNLRANTNLRVALRMADEDDSTDVVGTAVAASFDPSIPGRGVVKTGPARVVSFQSAYVGGHTSDESPPAEIDVRDFAFGQGAYWETPEVAGDQSADQGDADIGRIVENVQRAFGSTGLPPARQPWLPELSPTYRLEDLPSRRTDDELVFGVIDRPDDQTQPTVAFRPDRDGHMAVYGTGGSGKSTFLRSVAAAAAFAPARGGACDVYALDFGGRGLSMIEVLPNVGSVINGDDDERIVRLLKMLRATIDERAERYSQANADSIADYRAKVTSADDPRILLLLDNFAGFRQIYETSRGGTIMDLLESIVADGRSAGVHLVATADQVNAFTMSLRSVIQSQMALRLVADNDLLSLGVPMDVFDAQSPPGRGFVEDCDVQVGVLGGSQNVAEQAQAFEWLAAASARAGVKAAPPIARLDDDISRRMLDRFDEESLAFAVWDETLEPIGFYPVGCFTVGGPPRSGRTNAVDSLVFALLGSGQKWKTTVISPRQPEAGFPIDRSVVAGEDFAEQLSEVEERLAADAPSMCPHVVVIERVTGFDQLYESALESVLAVARAHGHFVVVEDESSAWDSYGGHLKLAKADRQGLVLQPETSDGDPFGVSLPPSRRADFPPGRGYYLHNGVARRVQVLRTGD